jgi:uncharacterized protein DUF955
VNYGELATVASRKAAQLRAANAIGVSDSVCPFDLAEKIGLNPRLVAAASFEGIYSPDPQPRVLVGANRPAGRQRFTCAHEIGHHIFEHGFCIDEVGERPESKEQEFLANRFASALLMPKIAVDAAMARRNSSVSRATAEELFVIAQDLGVGYSTLVGYLQFIQRAVTQSDADALRNRSLPELRERIAGFPVDADLLVLDSAWGTRPADLQIGDVVLMPETVEFDSPCLEPLTLPTRHFRAAVVGTCRIQLYRNRPPATVRVSKRGFAGLTRFRYVEEVADE